MCGIIGYIGSKEIISVLIGGLKKLEYRGYDSAGIAVVGENGLEVRRANGKISSLEESLKSSPARGTYGIGHTRWATHGRPSEENAHPHRDCSGTLVVVHNGIIENYLSLKKDLEEEGHTFTTETDTEVIAHLVEKNFKGSLEDSTLKAVCELKGEFAIAVISSQEPRTIISAKMGPPIVVGLGDELLSIATKLSFWVAQFSGMRSTGRS